MKKFGIVLLSAVTIFLFNACKKVVGDGPLVNETRDRGQFSAIAVSISGDVFYQEGTAHSISIQAQRNILEIIETPVKNSELEIKFKNNVRVGSHEKITITITAPTINSLGLSGSGNLRSIGTLQPNNLILSVSGSGNINIPSLLTTSLDARISGSGNINVSGGSVDQETLKISGSGSMDLVNLPAKNVTTNTSGSGSMKVNATETLNSTISGSGTVYYKGNPTVSTNISGSGRVMPL